MAGHPTPMERDERVTVPEGTDPAEFLARLLAVDPDDGGADDDSSSDRDRPPRGTT